MIVVQVGARWTVEESDGSRPHPLCVNQAVADSFMTALNDDGSTYDISVRVVVGLANQTPVITSIV